MPYKPSKALQQTIEELIQTICKTGGLKLSWAKFWMAIGMMIGEAEAAVIRGLQPDIPNNPSELVEVEGERIAGPIGDFILSCRTLITEEQKRESPNEALIAVLSNAVRLAREYDLIKNSRLVSISD